ncbi:MAG: M48 family metalloprotease [Betaproteobacteria bacterium]|nr:M48 family metalloprotease [Betaproteobacteria bacterium]
MDFFKAQEQARKKTRWLVFWFVLAVMGIMALAGLVSITFLYICVRAGGDPKEIAALLLMIIMISGIAILIYGISKSPSWWITIILLTVGPICFFAFVLTLKQYGQGYINLLWDNMNRPFLVCLIVGGAIVAVSLYKIRQIARHGGTLIAKQLGGQAVARNTQDLVERRLLNAIDEMSIAAGVPAPVAFVLTGETRLNAFAAGLTTQDSVIGVTRGLLDAMNRDELQGVIAHEISHIVNGDSRLNLKLIGLLYGIYAFTIMGRKLKKAAIWLLISFGILALLIGGFRGGIVLLFPPQSVMFLFLLICTLGFSLCVLGFVGLFFGRMLQAAASR